MVKLEDYSVRDIKNLISNINKKVKISGYSKMKKEQIIKTIREHPNLDVREGGDKVMIKVKSMKEALMKLPPAPRKEKPAPKKKEEPKKKLEPKKKKEKQDELEKENKKKQEELIKLLNKNKSKLEKIDYIRTGSRGKFRESSMYEKYRDEIINRMMYGRDNEVKQRLKSFEKDLKEEIKKSKKPFMTATKASGEVVELKERNTLEKLDNDFKDEIARKYVDIYRCCYSSDRLFQDDKNMAFLAYVYDNTNKNDRQQINKNVKNNKSKIINSFFINYVKKNSNEFIKGFDKKEINKFLKLIIEDKEQIKKKILNPVFENINNSSSELYKLILKNKNQTKGAEKILEQVILQNYDNNNIDDKMKIMKGLITTKNKDILNFKKEVKKLIKDNFILDKSGRGIKQIGKSKNKVKNRR